MSVPLLLVRTAFQLYYKSAKIVCKESKIVCSGKMQRKMDQYSFVVPLAVNRPLSIQKGARLAEF